MEAALWAYFGIGPITSIVIGGIIVRWILQERRR